MKSAFLLVILGLLSQAPGLLAAESVDPKLSDAVRKIHGALPLLRYTPVDLLNPARWETPHAMPDVEKLLEDPANAPLRAAAWNESLQQDHSPLALSAFIKKMLDPDGPVRPAEAGDAVRFAELERLPPEARAPIAAILKSIQKASPLAQKSYQTLISDERNRILGYYDIGGSGYTKAALNTPSARREIFASLRRFDQSAMVQASGIVLSAVQEQMPALMRWAMNESTPGAKSAFPLRFKTSAGDVHILGAGEDVTDIASLDNAALFIKWGDKSSYGGSAGPAQPGRVRVGLDFSRNVTIRSSGTAAGSGIFGIDLFYLPNGGGTKTIETGSYSQGFALCGTGGLFVNGSGSYQARRYSQGVGIFGAGFFINNDGENALYQTQLYGQGVGFTRGLGIFIHRGDGADLKAGLVDPDPRESLGATSLSQGVGCGPRAYAGGGIGMCLLKGDSIRVESSYFAQGAGYWHAAGSFRLDGSSCTVKARRYDQGSGVHSAFGMFALSGDDNRVVNWGVGPAFGWDASIGWAFVLGDRNRIQTEWSAGSASLGASRSFSVYSGNENRIDLPGLAGGQFIRDLSDLSIAWLEGRDNQLRSNQVKAPRVFSGPLFTSPWGLISGTSVALVNSVGFDKETWQRLPAEALPAEAQVNLETVLNASESLSAQKRVEQWVQVAAAFSLDKDQPRRARGKLISIKPEETRYLLDGVDFSDVDGFIQTRIIAALWGDPLLGRVPDAVKAETNPQKKVMLMSLLALSKAGTAAPALLRGLSDPDWRLQSASVRLLGLLLSRNAANISGRIFVLKAFEKYLASGGKGRAKQEFLSELQAQSFAEALGILSAAKTWELLERASLLEAAPEDITSSLNADQAEKILAMVLTMREDALENVRSELIHSEKMRQLAGERLAALLASIRSKRKEVRIDAPTEALTYDILTALGKMERAEDVDLIEPYLEYPSAKIREGAAVALARIGAPARKALERGAASWDSEQRMNAIAAVAESSEKSLVKLIEAGLSDENQEVRQLAMSAVEKLQRPLEGEKEKLKEKIRKDAEKKSADAAEVQRVFLFGEP